MRNNPSIYREYDIRGIAGVDFDEGFVEALGRAFGTKLRAERIGRVAVGRDCRITSPAYHKVLKAALRATGIDVIDIGQCPTPLLYFAVHHLDLLAGIEVTGSHNPGDHNGFKICLGKTTIYGDQIQELRRAIDEGRYERGDGREEAYPIIPAYQGFLEEQFGRVGNGVRVVVDSGNGTGGPVGPAIYRAMGCEVIELYSEPDGRFPNHHPDPTVEENMADLIAAVKRHGAHLGIAFDGDADRIGAVDETGRIIWGDEMLVVFSRAILREHPGATIVSEVKCSQRLYDDIERHGGNGIMWKVGHSLLKAKMKETGALLGGEMSGHLFFADRYFGYDDAIYAGARLIEIVAKSGRPLASMLADLPQGRVHARDSRGLPRRRQVQARRTGAGSLSRPRLRHRRHRRREGPFREGLGPDPRFEHAAGAGHALRGRRCRVARQLPSDRGYRARFIEGTPDGCGVTAPT